MNGWHCSLCVGWREGSQGVRIGEGCPDRLRVAGIERSWGVERSRSRIRARAG